MDAERDVNAGQSGLWCGALGPLEVVWNGEQLTLGGAKQQSVLALLVLEANRVVSVERLLRWVWDDGDDARRASTLQVYVSNLRRLLAPAAEGLGRPIIDTRRPGYVLQLDDDQSDLLHFHVLCKQGAAAMHDDRPDDAVTSLRAALALWRGDLLSGLPVDVTEIGDAARFELMRTAVLEQTAEAELAAGRHREFLSELQTWVDAHPLDERLRGHFMIALYRCGRQADALARFREGRELLVEELGIEPSHDLRDLQTRILTQDRTLDWVSAGLRNLAAADSTALRSSVLVAPGHLELGGTIIDLERSSTTIGRLPDQDLVLDDVGVSRRHAEIRRHGSSYRLVDAGSANGTVVNGQRIAEHALDDGDEIRMGDIVMTFRSDG